jgi:uncharacterized membrane protein
MERYFRGAQWMDLAPERFGRCAYRGKKGQLRASVYVSATRTDSAAELVTDQLPSTPARTKPAGLIPRILLGGLCGAAVASAGGQSLALGAVLGAVGGVAGAFAGYEVRTRLVKALGVPDFVIAVLEDAVAIGGGLLLLSRY